MTNLAFHITRVAPIGRYNITADRVQRILSDGLNWNHRNFTPQTAAVGSQLGDFNVPGVYCFGELASTRRLWPKSHVALFAVDLEGLDTRHDSWGGHDALIVNQVVPASQLELIHTYQPGERVLTQLPQLQRLPHLQPIAVA